MDFGICNITTTATGNYWRYTDTSGFSANAGSGDLCPKDYVDSVAGGVDLSAKITYTTDVTASLTGL